MQHASDAVVLVLSSTGASFQNPFCRDTRTAIALGRSQIAACIVMKERKHIAFVQCMCTCMSVYVRVRACVTVRVRACLRSVR